MKDYYEQQATSYDQRYAFPERQDALALLEERLTELLEDKRVLEIACGTGYWTQLYAPFARSVLATDINPPLLDVAAAKDYADADVTFAVADAFDPPSGQYDACLAAFWWSHIKKEEQSRFLATLQQVVGSGGSLVLIDDNLVEGATLPTARTDKDGNTYQLRVCEDGSRAEILKNYPADSFLRKRIAAFARDIRIRRTDYYWMLTGTFK